MNKAASLSFYTVISVFPMLLILAALSHSFVGNEFVLEGVREFSKRVLPYQSELILQTVSSFFSSQKRFSWFGVVTLFISAQILFVNFEKIVNGLLHTEKPRHFLKRRLLFFMWMVGVIFVLLAPLLFEMFSGWVGYFGFSTRFISQYFVKGSFIVFGFAVFWVVMMILPTHRIAFRRLVMGSAIFALTLQAGKLIFKWYTYKNFERYNLAYGSLSSVILTLLWIFYFYNLFLFFVYWVGRDRDPVYLERRQTGKS